MQQQKSFIELTLPDYSPIDLEADICILEETLEHLLSEAGDVYQTHDALKSFSRARKRAIVSNLVALAMRLNCEIEYD